MRLALQPLPSRHCDSKPLRDHHLGMQFDDFSTPDSAGWGVVSPKSGDIVSNALKKEKVLKEILSYQEDLRGASYFLPPVPEGY